MDRLEGQPLASAFRPVGRYGVKAALRCSDVGQRSRYESRPGDGPSEQREERPGMLNPFSNRRLLRSGEPANARIVEMIDHAYTSTPSRVRMTLEIDRPGAPRYQVRDIWRVSGAEPIGRGSDICVVVDPEHRHRVAIDWSRTHAEYRDDIAKRRKLMSIGVPVPVSKLRADAEEVGYELWAPDPEAPDRPASEELLTVAPNGDGEREPAQPTPPETATSANAEAVQADAALADPPSASVDEPLIGSLERLVALRRAGELSDDEFEAAKRLVLTEA